MVLLNGTDKLFQVIPIRQSVTVRPNQSLVFNSSNGANIFSDWTYLIQGFLDVVPDIHAGHLGVVVLEGLRIKSFNILATKFHIRWKSSDPSLPTGRTLLNPDTS